jgi:phospholipid transport system substrate-binding protein
MTSQRTLGAAVGALVVIGLCSGPAAAGPATDQLKPEIARVVAVLESPALASAAKAAERRQAIRTITDTVFDWTEMARRALARHWEARSEAERQEFVALFRDLVERAYIGKIEQYGGEPIVYVGESVDGDYATVKTRVIARQNREVSLDYRMSRQGDRWRVYDVVIEGISLVGNYRTQFDGIIRSSSYEELVRKLRTRAS